MPIAILNKRAIAYPTDCNFYNAIALLNKLQELSNKVEGLRQKYQEKRVKEAVEEAKKNG